MTVEASKRQRCRRCRRYRGFEGFDADGLCDDCAKGRRLMEYQRTLARSQQDEERRKLRERAK